MEVSNMELEGFSDQNINIKAEPDQRRLTLRGKVFVTCMVISSFPLIIPSLLTLSALGATFSIPIGLFLAGYSFTDNIIGKIFSSSESYLQKGGIENDMVASKESFTGDQQLNDTEGTARWEEDQVEAGKGYNDTQLNGPIYMDDIKECCMIEMPKGSAERGKSKGLGELSISNIQCHIEDNSCLREEKKEDLFAEEGGPIQDKVDRFDFTPKNNTTENIVETGMEGCNSSLSVHPLDDEAECTASRKRVEEKLRLVGAVLGCRTGHESTVSEQVSAIFSMVGITESTPPDDIFETEENLRYLMSVVGVE